MASLICAVIWRFARTTTVPIVLAILIDNASHYAIADIETRYTNGAAVLRAFGWQVEYVLGKDWYQDKEATIARLCTTLEN